MASPRVSLKMLFVASRGAATYAEAAGGCRDTPLSPLRHPAALVLRKRGVCYSGGTEICVYTSLPFHT